MQLQNPETGEPVKVAAWKIIGLAVLGIFITTLSGIAAAFVTLDLIAGFDLALRELLGIGVLAAWLKT